MAAVNICNYCRQHTNNSVLLGTLKANCIFTYIDFWPHLLCTANSKVRENMLHDSHTGENDARVQTQISSTCTIQKEQIEQCA